MKQLIINIDDDLQKELEYISTNINDYISSLIKEDIRKKKENLMDEIVVENREAFKELVK